MGGLSRPPLMLLRADGGPRLGRGHLTRSGALGRGWRERGGAALFLTRAPSPETLRNLSAADIPVHSLPESDPDDGFAALSAEIARGKASGAALWVVLDGYHLGPDYQAKIRATGARLLVIDDTAHQPRYDADVILNQNLGAERLSYVCSPETVLLLGPRYALLRPEFRPELPSRQAPDTATRVLVSMGGADPAGLTDKVLRALQATTNDRLEPTVLVGSENPRYEQLRRDHAQSRVPIRWVRDTRDMRGLLCATDLAVSAGGSTCWELARCGVPAILLIAAENQRPSVSALGELGAALDLGDGAGVDPAAIAAAISRLASDRQARQRMADAGMRLVDGRGAERVCAILAALEPGAALPLRVRPTGREDAFQIWRLANDPGVRSRSFNQDSFPFDHHLDWFYRKLEAPETSMWVLELEGLVAAQIRYDRMEPDVAEIGFSVVPAFRGRSLGTRILAETWEPACRRLSARRARGLVFPDNPASLRAFEKAGFRRCPPVSRDGRPCEVFEKELP